MISNGPNNSGDNLAMAYVARVIESWRSTGKPDTKRALAERSDLNIPDRLVLDLVYEEFCLRHDRGENPDASTFCDQFPTLRESIKDMLDVHETIGSDSEIADSLIPPQVVWPEPGDTYRGYQIQRCLGKGALARVYLASHEELGDRHVALKVSRDTKEAATAGRLDHPNVMDVNWVEYDASRNATWMCMPYCGAATLRDVIEQLHGDRPAPTQACEILEVARSKAANATEIRQPHHVMQLGLFVEGCLHIGVRLSDALSHAHERGILHRDLKPTNVLLTESGAPKLLDFNLSSDPNVDVNRSGGTLGYMAPEHINSVFGFASGNAHVDARSEIYALGVILYELMTGQLPFGKPDLDSGPWVAAEEMLSSQSRGEFAKPSILNPDIGEDVEAVLLRCLKVDSDQRYQTVRELREALSECRDRRLKEQEAEQRRKRNNLATICGMFVGLILFGAVQARRDAAIWTVDEGRRAFYENAAANDLEGAINAIDTVPVEFHTAGDTEMLAYIKAYTGHEASAAPLYRSLHRRYPKEFRFVNNWGFCLERADPVKALAVLRDALKQRPNSPIALRNLVRVHAVLLQRFPDSPKVLRDARTHLEWAVAENPNSKLVHEHGANMLAMGFGPDVLSDLPGSPEVQENLRRRLSCQPELAFEFAMRAVKLGSSPEAFHPALYAAIGKEREAELRAAKSGRMRYSLSDYLIKPQETPREALDTL